MNRIAELLALYGLIPLALAMASATRGIWIWILWGGAFLAWRWLRRTQSRTFRDEWAWRNVTREALRSILIRFAFFGVLLAASLWFWDPMKLFSFPRERPHIWALVMLLYPALSVVPQEIVFRSFFFARYAPVFSTERRAIMAEATAFGFAHIIMHNPVAMIFSFVGGYMFGHTYRKHRSLALVSLEHALYGCLLFTLGWGKYFYRG